MILSNFSFRFTLTVYLFPTIASIKMQLSVIAALIPLVSLVTAVGNWVR